MVDFKPEEIIVEEKERTSVQEKILAIIYIICMVAGWYSATYRIPWYIVYVMMSIVILMGIIVLGVKGNTEDAGHPAETALYYMIGYMIMLIVSFLLNAYQMNALRVMSRGFSDILYQLIGIAFVCSSVYLFKHRAIGYIFYSMIICYFMIFFFVIKEYGFTTTVNDVKNVILFGADNTEASGKLEVHDVTFAIGAFLFWFIINFKNEKHAVFKIILALIAVLLGYKRFILPAVAICFVFYNLFGFVQKKAGRRFTFRLLLCVQAGFILSTFAYMFIIKQGILEYIINLLGINAMGRTTLYNAVNEYYVLSPSYIGRGLGWINRNLQLITGHVNGTEGLHCNILELYIELGFIGYLLFFGYQMIGQCILFYKRFSLKAAVLYATLYMYCWFTYLTDNTIFYRGINAAVRLIVFGFIVFELERSRRKWKKV